MELSYFHSPAEVPDGPLPEVAVVIDVLRATTTIAYALALGAEAVQVYASLEQLQQEGQRLPRERRLLLGERGGRTLPGFDLGNSPADLPAARVPGCRILMSTTNGTRALERVREVRQVYTAALVNLGAVLRALRGASSVWLVGSGWEDRYSLEDSFAAGALVAGLEAALVNDEAQAAQALWERWKGEPEACLRRSSHGRRLAALGDHRRDFQLCAALDSLDLVPRQTAPGCLQC